MKFSVDVDVWKILGDCENENWNVYRVNWMVELGLVRLEIEWYWRVWMVSWLVWGRARLISGC
jgi:hypothetical protein